MCHLLWRLWWKYLFCMSTHWYSLWNLFLPTTIAWRNMLCYLHQTSTWGFKFFPLYPPSNLHNPSSALPTSAMVLAKLVRWLTAVSIFLWNTCKLYVVIVILKWDSFFSGKCECRNASVQHRRVKRFCKKCRWINTLHGTIRNYCTVVVSLFMLHVLTKYAYAFAWSPYSKVSLYLHNTAEVTSRTLENAST